MNGETVPVRLWEDGMIHPQLIALRFVPLKDGRVHRFAQVLSIVNHVLQHRSS